MYCIHSVPDVVQTMLKHGKEFYSGNVKEDVLKLTDPMKKL